MFFLKKPNQKQVQPPPICKTARLAWCWLGIVNIFLLSSCLPSAPSEYQFKETQALVNLVETAAKLIEKKGEAAFPELLKRGSAWLKGETYIFVIDTLGNTPVHPMRNYINRNNLSLKDQNGKPFIRWFIHEVTNDKNKSAGWSHYLWPKPKQRFPAWKSSYIKLVVAPSGKKYIVGSGRYNLKTEKAFIVDTVSEAGALIEKRGKAAFKILRDPAGEFLYKDIYVFVLDHNGIVLINPAFPIFEGKNALNYRDVAGKYFIREMFDLLKTQDRGWIEYMWPKPNQAVAQRKTTYIQKVNFGKDWVLIGGGTFFDNDKATPLPRNQLNAKQLMELARNFAKQLKKYGSQTIPSINQRANTLKNHQAYLMLLDPEGKVILDSSNSTTVGKKFVNATDVAGRPISRWIKEISNSKSGEGWIHYLWPKPNEFYPIWTSAFVKRARLATGKTYVLCVGVYGPETEKMFLVNSVNQAAYLLLTQGAAALPVLSNKNGRFNYLNATTFVSSLDGTAIVYGAVPPWSGKNILTIQDANGKYFIKEIIKTANAQKFGWINFMWPKPGESDPSKIIAYFRKIKTEEGELIVGIQAFATPPTSKPPRH